MANEESWDSFEELISSLKDLKSVKLKMIARDIEQRPEEDDTVVALRIESQLWETLSDGLVQASQYAETQGEELPNFIIKIRAMLKRTKDASAQQLVKAQHEHQIDNMIKEKKMIDALDAHFKLLDMKKS